MRARLTKRILAWFRELEEADVVVARGGSLRALSEPPQAALGVRRYRGLWRLTGRLYCLDYWVPQISSKATSSGAVPPLQERPMTEPLCTIRCDSPTWENTHSPRCR